MNNTLERLDEILESRKQSGAEESYVAGLHARGLNKILEKVGEEATETILAAKDLAAADAAATDARQAVISETADLWFHCLVMLSHLDISSNDIMHELERRFGTSGLEEKAARHNA